MEGEVLSLAFGGYGVIKKNKEVYFISGALPGEIIEFSLDYKKRGVNFGKAIKIIKNSKDRIEPKCKHFLECGGCHFQNLRYEVQIKEKEKILKDILKKIGKLEAEFDPPVFSKEYNYRSKVQFNIDEEGDLCFFERKSNNPLKIKTCPVLEKPLEVFLKKIIKNEIKIKNSQSLTLYFSRFIIGRIETNENNLKDIWEKLKSNSLKGLWKKPKNGYGKYLIKRKFDSYFIYHSPFSFMQINQFVNKLMVEELLKYLKNFKDLKILEAYAGVGNFSIPIALNLKSVTSLEPSKSNFYLLRKNKEENNVLNLNIFLCDFESFKGNEKTDILIIDPPRIGLSNKAIEKIFNLKPEILIYISCDPPTQARDLKILSKNYKIEKIKLVDMFPQTYHIESISFLKRIQETH